MKFAPVCPIHVYEALEAAGQEYLGDYFLLLAHDVLQHQERYERFFARRNCTIIMDNSVIELGNACTAQNLFDAASTIAAGNDVCVAIPDVLQDGVKTLERADKFLDEWAGIPQSDKFEKMYIPQGKDIKDFSISMEQALYTFPDEFEWVGIARNLTDRIFPTRKIATGYISRIVGNHVRLHLLGFSDNVADDIDTCLHLAPYIEGIDSAVPLRLGTKGISVGIADAFPDTGPRGDWWETVIANDLLLENTLAFRQRIER